MVNYKLLGFKNSEDYIKYLLDTVLETNRTYDFYVDWNKVFHNVKKHLIEISILNSLNKSNKDELENDFKYVLIKYPEVIKVLPLILAISYIKNDILPVMDIDLNKVINISFNENDFSINDIVNFSIKTGLLDLIYNIDDLYSYLVGVETGLDTNARKNRSGKIFENIVGDFLNKSLDGFNDCKLVKEDSSVFLDRQKRIDYVIYKNNKPLIAIECNFYNASGSKPIEVAHAYANLQLDFNKEDIIFIWVTDGLGWKKMSNTLYSVEKNIDYILNFHMLNNYFETILQNTIM